MQEQRNFSKQYEHVISLGAFCSVASELDRVGLRSTSSPFDWLICDFDSVINLMKSHFANFLDYNSLIQSSIYHERYYNSTCGIYFYHDFNKRKPLKKQISDVSLKYDRRIRRFYQDISSPTLFVRYISSEKELTGRLGELEWLEENYEKVIQFLKSFNSRNDLILIANTGVNSSLFKIYNVAPDENDIVARKFLDKNSELYDFLNGIECPRRNENVIFYKKKMKNKGRFFIRLKNKIKLIVEDRTKYMEYIHDKQY